MVGGHLLNWLLKLGIITGGRKEAVLTFGLFHLRFGFELESGPYPEMHATREYVPSDHTWEKELRYLTS